MILLANHSLKDLNTFSITAVADEFVNVSSIKVLHELYERNWFKDNDLLVLGGGSNFLFVKERFSKVVHISLGGIRIYALGDNQALIEAGAGVEWDNFIAQTLKLGYRGLENLSLIPGRVGAAPIQNIGAYGVELKDVFHSLRAFDTQTGAWKTFTKEECEFGYRSSVFKTSARGRYIIASVSFVLHKSEHANISYGSLRDHFENLGRPDPKAPEVREAVMKIRRAKLPDPEELGNAGSFFKNPVVDQGFFAELQKKHPGIPHYPAGDREVKLAAGWLIDQCGLKGYRKGDAGVHEKQALVLVNHGRATGKEVLALAGEVRECVSRRFGILLEPEVNIIGGSLK